MTMEPHCRFTHYAGRRLHLGVCGSVAAFRAPDLLRWWRQAGINVGVTLTPAARRFIAPLTFEALGASPLYTDMFAPGDTFAHLEPGQIAQAMIIAPASAATLARMAQGQADEMLACQALAFDGPVVVAPAMNPRMWMHPATRANMLTLEARGVAVVPPDRGGTACGDQGTGRLADLRRIYLTGLKALSPQDMFGLNVMITLGPTRESWDAVRFWSNPSSGIMGASLAVAAWLRGAAVTAVCGPGCPWLPEDILRHDVRSARDMFTVAEELWPSMDVGIFTAAVADFSPEPFGAAKFKKADAADGFRVRFLPNPDILKTLATRRAPRQKVIGFAAETAEDLPAVVRTKRAAKGADILVGNRVGNEGEGFASATNTVVVSDAAGREEQWPSLPKPDVAWRLCSWLLEL